MSEQESESDYALDRMVQLVGETSVDARPSDNRPDLADSLPDHLGQFRVRVRASDPKEATMARGLALRHQPRLEPHLYPDPVWAAEPEVGGSGYSGRVGHDRLDDGGYLAALSLGGRGSGAVSGLGVTGDGSSTVDHVHELVRRA